MSFLEPACVVHEHSAGNGRVCDLGFAISGRIMQQLALSLAPGQWVATWAWAVIAHDQSIRFENAGPPSLLMAASDGDVPARLVLSPGGQMGVFDLTRMKGRVLLPQDSFLAAGPGVKLRPYSHVRGLTGARRPDGLVLMLAEGEGRVFSGGQGEVSEVVLCSGEMLAVRGGAIAALGATVVIDRVVPSGSPMDGASAMAMLSGPGRVWLQASGETLMIIGALSRRDELWAAPAARIEHE